jgi:tetratricopeptide (TPR) repeat protein
MNLAIASLAAFLTAGPFVVVPGDLDTAFQNLKDAEAKKDAVQVKKLAAEACALARDVISAPVPEDPEEKDAWSKRVSFARDVELFTEYALYKTALQGPPATTVDFLSTLEQQNPKSKYLADAYGLYFYALHQTGAASKIPALAEKAIGSFPENDDALLVLADTAMARKQTDRALSYAKRLTVALNKHGKPEGMSATEWERKRSGGLGRGYWIAGVIQGEKGQYFEADRNLRASLPLIGGNDAMKAPALFYLGMANYQLGKMTMKKAQVLEGVKFSEQAAAIQGPLAQQAWHNAHVMKDEAAKMR